jgi:hypothetical protein
MTRELKATAVVAFDAGMVVAVPRPSERYLCRAARDVKHSGDCCQNRQVKLPLTEWSCALVASWPA